MSTRVYTPRRVFLSVQEFAAHLSASPQGVYPYLIGTRDGWRLRPISEDALRQWRKTVWRREVSRA